MVALVASLDRAKHCHATVNGLTINENLPATSKGVTCQQTISVTRWYAALYVRYTRGEYASANPDTF